MDCKGVSMIFLSPVMIDIIEWNDNDPRIHNKPNCRYKDKRTALDIVVQFVKKGMVDVE